MRTFVKFSISVLLLAIGIAIGLFWDNLPYVVLDSKLSYGDIADFILALVLAIVIPIVLNTWLDNERHQKDFLIDEIRGCLDCLKTIKEKIDGCSIAGITTEADKKEIHSKISFYDLRASSLISQLEENFKWKSSRLRPDILKETIEYWREVTGGEFANNGYNIDPSFCKNHDKALLKLESCLKIAVHKVNKF